MLADLSHFINETGHIFFALIWPMLGIAWLGMRHSRRMAELALQREIAARQAPAPAADTAELAALRDRVAVLERILTENHRGAALADAIEQLRP